MMNERMLMPGTFVRHFKGNFYQVVCLANDSETGKKCVVYQALYGDYKIYVRDYDMFMEKLDGSKYPDMDGKYRFEIVEPPFKADAFEDVKTDNSINKPESMESEKISDNMEGVNPLLIKFLDCDTATDKIGYLKTIKNRLDDRLITDMAASLDLTVDEGDLEGRYYSLLNCLNTMARFECGRLR